MAIILAIILAGCIAFCLYVALIFYRARNMKRIKAREEAEMIEVIGQWIVQDRQARRPARSGRRPYEMPTYPPDISFVSDRQISGPHKLKQRTSSN